MSDPTAPQDPFASGRPPEPVSLPDQPPQPGAASAYGAPPPAYTAAPPAYGGYGPPPAPYGAQDGAQAGGYGGQQPYGYPKNSVGVWALVLGIVGIAFGGGFVAGIPAIIVGHLSRRAVAAGQANNGAMATAGIVLGWIATVVGVVLLAALIILAVSGGWGGWDTMMNGTSSSTLSSV